ncbi:hypothetical protein K461DRAFT_91738 [Myriangium duriaei CBS 260.36]|uniref:Uncharacterized protein n=1 Tax=Myriangium duriaei CBS 260.36 TaxID=1168546 RepID=A0A9P4JAL9_9PEZI|nr:hypothetical protein K461DRAFT_91738 [Myriangium duriaei CBS 260.36]
MHREECHASTRMSSSPCRVCSSLFTSLVGAGSLDVAGLLALVADALAAGLGGAVAAQVTDLTTFVALLALGAVAGHVAETTAGVASLATTGSTVATAEPTLAAEAATAVAGNVADLAALVALHAATGGTAERATTGGTTRLGALARHMAGLTAAIAGLLLLRVLAFAAQVALLAAVVAGGVALVGAVTSLVAGVAAYRPVSICGFCACIAQLSE